MAAPRILPIRDIYIGVRDIGRYLQDRRPNHQVGSGISPAVLVDAINLLPKVKEALAAQGVDLSTPKRRWNFRQMLVNWRAGHGLMPHNTQIVVELLGLFIRNAEGNLVLTPAAANAVALVNSQRKVTKADLRKDEDREPPPDRRATA